MKKTQSLNLAIPIINLVGDYLKGNFDNLPPNEIYTLKLNYPLRKEFKFQIKTGKKGMHLFSLLKKIGKIYNDIYDDQEEYGVWGHFLDDLCLEGISINHVSKTISLDIGS